MRRLLVAAFVLIPASAHAALPPYAQNIEDLRTLTAFVESHRAVASTIRSIDMETYTIHFGNDCRAEFERKAPEMAVPRPIGSLVLATSTCPVE